MEKATFISFKEPFFEGNSSFPLGVWQQYGILFLDSGVQVGRLVWHELEGHDPACGDDSGACDWDHPDHFWAYDGDDIDFDGDEVDQVSAETFWIKMLQDGYAEITPPFNSVYLSQDDENNPYVSQYYMHDNAGRGCTIRDYQDFCETLENLDKYLEQQTNEEK